MAEIVLCCGKVGSGKSTYARRLEAEHGFLLLSADEWMLRLHGEIADREEFADKLSRCKAMIDDLALGLLERGMDVVLDSGFWTLEERAKAKALFAQAGHRVSLLYFALPDERQLANLAARNGGPGGLPLCLRRGDRPAAEPPLRSSGRRRRGAHARRAQRIARARIRRRTHLSGNPFSRRSRASARTGRPPPSAGCSGSRRQAVR